MIRLPDAESLPPYEEAKARILRSLSAYGTADLVELARTLFHEAETAVTDIEAVVSILRDLLREVLAPHFQEQTAARVEGLCPWSLVETFRETAS